MTAQRLNLWQTQKLKMWHLKKNCELAKIVRKLKISSCDKTQKLKLRQNTNCDKAKKLATKLKNSNCNKAKKKIKKWPNFKIKIVTKLKQQQNSKAQMATKKLKNSNYDKLKKLKLRQNLNSNRDKTQKLKFWNLIATSTYFFMDVFCPHFLYILLNNNSANTAKITTHKNIVGHLSHNLRFQLY